MKTKLFYLTIISAFLIIGCNQVDFNADFTGVQPNQQKADVNFNVGMATAKAFVDILNKDTAGVLRKEVQTITPIVYLGDTLLYLVNYKDNKGWLAISGDKRTPGMLAYADEGVFETESLNPGQMTWLDDVANQIYVLKHRSGVDAADTLTSDFRLWNKIETLVENAGNIKKINPNVTLTPVPNPADGHWDLIGIISQELPVTQVGPLVQTKWGQGFPWNTCVPYNINTGENCATGCVAVAGAQMLYYLHYLWNVPATMYSSGSCSGYVASSNGYSYTFSFGTRTSTAWDDMAKQISSYYDATLNKTVVISNASTDKVAVLMGYVGSKVSMSYGEQSGANTEDLATLFSNEGINSSYVDFNSSSLVPSLNNKLPLIIRADATQNNHTFLGMFHLWYSYDDGHAWIIDGYENKNIKYTYYYEWSPNVTPTQPVITPNYKKTEEETVSSPNYFLMNWGADGGFDSGRYTMGNDAVWTITSYENNKPITLNFQYRKKMLYNFSKK